MSIAKHEDIAHAIQEDKLIFLFNVPRQAMEFMQYTIVELLKAMMFFRPKDNSRTKIFFALGRLSSVEKPLILLY